MVEPGLVRNVKVEGTGTVTLQGADEAHRLGIQFDNVVFDDPGKVRVLAAHADVVVGPGAFNLAVQGNAVSVSGKAGSAAPLSCRGEVPGNSATVMVRLASCS